MWYLCLVGGLPVSSSLHTRPNPPQLSQRDVHNKRSREGGLNLFGTRSQSLRYKSREIFELSCVDGVLRRARPDPGEPIGLPLVAVPTPTPGHPPNFSGQRNAGVPVETPEVTTGFQSALDAGGTLRARSRILVAAPGAVQRACQAELAGLAVANVESEPETQMPLLFVTKRTSSHCLKKVACTWSIMKIRNASVERSLFAGTLIRLMCYEAEKEAHASR